jgi:hypothetical protein
MLEARGVKVLWNSLFAAALIFFAVGVYYFITNG